MRVIVTGSRRVPFTPAVESALSKVMDDHPGERITVIHGDAAGIDTVAGMAAEKLGLNVYRFPAEWKAFGKAAGGLRNQEMLDTITPDLVLAFPDRESRGTYDMVERAERAGIPVVLSDAFI